MGRQHVSNFRELKVYRLAMREAGEVYTRTQSFPSDDRFGLTQQIRRSSSSVPALIAEAWPRRCYKAAFANALRIAAGEVCETQCWLEQARDRGYLSEADCQSMLEAWEHINAMLYSMIGMRDRFPPIKAQ